MKTIIIITILTFGVHMFTQAEEFSIDALNQKIENLIEDKAHLADNGVAYHFRDLNPEFIEFKTFISSHWQKSLEEIDKWVGEEPGKRLVWTAMQELPAASYITAFEWMVGKLVSDEFDKKHIESLMDAHGTMIYFLADNYQHPRIVAALNQFKTKIDGNEKLVELIDAILNGERKQYLDEMREDHEDSWEADWPKVILPP